MSVESVGPVVADPPQSVAAGRRLVELDQAEALALLSGVGYGRVVFTARALPAIRPVNHLVVDGDIIIRTHLGGAITDAVDGNGVVVAYEADDIDPALRLGWSVVATGYALPVTDPKENAHFATLLIPWIDKPMDTVIRIRPAIVTGFRLVPST